MDGFNEALVNVIGGLLIAQILYGAYRLLMPKDGR